MDMQPYNIRIFEEKGEEFDAIYDVTQDMFEVEIETVTKAINVVEQEYMNTDRWLEVGAGSGRFGGALGFGWGLDPSKKKLRMAESRIPHLIQGMAEALPFNDGVFSLVGLFTSMEFLARPKCALQEIHRVLAPQGYLLVFFLNDKSEQYAKKGKNIQPPFYDEATFYNLDSLKSLIENEGFTFTHAYQVLHHETDARAGHVEAGGDQGLVVSALFRKNREMLS